MVYTEAWADCLFSGHQITNLGISFLKTENKIDKGSERERLKTKTDLQMITSNCMIINYEISLLRFEQKVFPYLSACSRKEGFGNLAESCGTECCLPASITK